MATASTIIKTASNEIGVKETGNNNVKYNTEYYGKAVNGDAFPALFIPERCMMGNTSLSEEMIPAWMAAFRTMAFSNS